MVQQELQSDFDRFIEFGQVLDRKSRTYLVQFLKSKFFPDEELPPALQEDYYNYFKEALEEIFTIEELMDLCKENPSMRQKVASDSLRFVTQSLLESAKKNPFQEEKTHLGKWAHTPSPRFVDMNGVLLQYLSGIYDRLDLDHQFYGSKFQALREGKTYSDLSDESKDKLERLIHDLLAVWDARLSAKILKYRIKHLDEQKHEFTETLKEKVVEYKKLLSIISPFADYSQRFWDFSRGLWKNTSFNVLEKYDELLKNEKSIRELADLLGRLREAEIETEEEEMEKTIVRKEWVDDPTLRSEITGVHESDDLSNLLSSEAALLGHEETENLFYKKFVDKSLLTFRYEDKRLVSSTHTFTEIHRRVKTKEKGPFIICIDTSDSMFGRAEQIAKVLCFGILKMAIRENRKAYLINFSTGIQTIDLYKLGDSLDELAAFLTMSFHGGTDVSLALYEVFRQLETSNYKDADVLVMSDFIMYKIDEDILAKVDSFRQNLGTQFHSLTLSDEPVEMIIERFDNNWLYDPKEKGVIKDLSRKVLSL